MEEPIATLLLGKPVADALTQRVAARVRLLREQGTVPGLAIVRVGDAPSDLSYERAALKRCEAVGIEACVVALPADVSQRELLDAIDQVNADNGIRGCLLLRPLPPHVDEAMACERLDPAKDVDCVTMASLAGVFSGRPVGFAPCTAEAVMRVLGHHQVPLDGANVTVVGRSLVVGRPVSVLLQAKNATVTMCHSHTRDLAASCRAADVVVVAAGRPGLLGKEAVRAGQVVIDVGTNWDDEAGRLTGDVAFDEVAPLVSAITPVPRGVGSVTTAVLADHVVTAAERSAR